MALFDFTGTDFSLVSSTSSQITFVEQGVTFTLSLTSFDALGRVFVSGSNLAFSGIDIVATLQIDAPTGVSFTGAFELSGSYGFPTGDEGKVSTLASSVELFDTGDDPTSGPFNTSMTSVSSPSVVFTLTGAGILALGSFETNISCFLAGTLIATPDGAVAVEQLSSGDRVTTVDGRAVGVEWLGRQFVDPARVHPLKVNPICIRAGAIAAGVPQRDLYVSPDHAIAIDGLLINAGALVNGSSIYQVAQMPPEGFTYYHVETEAHEILLAEGCPAESFLDYSDTFGFDNSGDRTARVIPEMDMPRISTARMVPERIRQNLSPRHAA